MDIYEQRLVDLINEAEEENNTGIYIEEISMPKAIDSFDKEKFTDLMSRANGLLCKNNTTQGMQKENTIVNVIMDSLHFALNILSSSLSGTIIDKFTPDKFKFLFKFKFKGETNNNKGETNNNKGKTKNIRINPIKYILSGIISNLLGELFEMAVAPARRSSMINSYKKMVATITELKNKSKDEETKKDCEKLIKRINKEIEYLSNPKGDKEMKTIGEMLQECEIDSSMDFDYDNMDTEYMDESNIDESYEDFGEALESVIEAVNEACGSKKEGCKTEGCGSKGCKKEESDMKDDDPDLDPENESAFDFGF